MPERKHSWISNTAFARITGIKFVCFDCGEGVANRHDASKVCPGVRPSRKEDANV